MQTEIGRPAPGSLAARIEATGGRSSGFDYLRIVLATLVVFDHSFTSAYGFGHDLQWAFPAAQPIEHLILPMFFGLSGFLVTGSLERSRTLITFLGLRAIRIVPALAVDVFVAAFLIGPALTTLPLSQYVSDPQFRHYFLNILGNIHYTLPGLFADIPNKYKVNAQLWTIPYELSCYAMLAALAAGAVFRRRNLMLIATLVGQALWIFEALHRPDNAQTVQALANGCIFILSFLAGVTAYLWRDRIPYSRGLFVLCVILSVVLAYVPSGSCYLALPGVYMTIYLGLLNPKRVWIVSSGDYSYGLYLYGSPILQTLATVSALRHWYFIFPLGWTIDFVLAFLSWNLVEKRALKLRSALPRIESAISRALLGVADPGQIIAAAGSPRGLVGIAALSAGFASAILLIDAHTQPGHMAALVSFALAFAWLRIAKSQSALAGSAPA